MRQDGFSLIELLIVVAIILIIAAIAIPNLLRSRIAANETSTVGSLRTINTAEITYNSTYPTVGFTCTLSNLGPPSSGNPTSTAAGLIDSNLASGNKAGYTIAPGTCSTAGAVTVDYQWKADPQSVGTTGQRYFCTDASGVIKFHDSSSTTCLTGGTPI
jgi:prepilin-type N-terminal cleavage/methylation domain-containing protein